MMNPNYRTEGYGAEELDQDLKESLLLTVDSQHPSREEKESHALSPNPCPMLLV